jgi:hypothetical protein
MMKLVGFAAAASLCLAPFVRLADAGALSWPFVLMGEGVGIPLVLAIVALLLLRTNARKDKVVRILLLISAVTALGVAMHPLLGPSPIWSTGATRSSLYLMSAILSIPVATLLHSLRTKP